MRITRQPLLFDLWVWSNVRETPQIRILEDRSHHPHDVRRLRAGTVLSAGGTIAAVCLREQRHREATETKDRSN